MSFKSYLSGFGIVVALVATPDSALAAQDDAPNFSYLRNLKEISFFPIYEGMDDSKTVCLPTQENLTTAIQFVANQSVGLRILSWRQKDKEIQDLQDQQKTLGDEFTALLNQKDWTNPTFSARRDAIHAQENEVSAKIDNKLWMPTLYISITAFHVYTFCAVDIRLHLDADLKKAPIPRLRTTNRSTTKSVSLGEWAYMLQGPANAGFPAKVTDTVGLGLKTLVNEWTKQQTADDWWQRSVGEAREKALNAPQRACPSHRIISPCPGGSRLHEPRDHTHVHRIALSDRSQRLTRGATLDSLGALISPPSSMIQMDQDESASVPLISSYV